MLKKVTTILFFLLGIFTTLKSQSLNHENWSAFLQDYVSETGRVDYSALAKNPESLYKYTKQIEATQFNNSWSDNEKLAFWINAYNAFTIQLIVENYPINSIKDIQKPWDKKFISLSGMKMSLNHIEHEILRKMDEPRIHFAIVCASESCPKLQNKAFVADMLEVQLTNATKEFLNDNSKNRITENELELSKIFKWFSKDFKQDGNLIDFLNQYSELEISQDAKIKYLDYSWELND